MSRALALLALLAVVGCGPDPAPGGGLGFEVGISAAVLDELREFQISVLRAEGDAGRLDCAQAQRTCASSLAAQDPSRFLKLRDPEGRQTITLRFDAALDAGAQEVSVGGIPVGTDYAYFVEALGDTQLLASSCRYLQRVEEGRNATQLVTLTNLDPRPDCDPRF